MTKGSVELRSGVWAWRAIGVGDVGVEEVDETYFFFRLRGSETSRMYFRWSGAFPEVDESAIALQARHPRERELRAPDGATWLFYEVSRPELSLAVSGAFPGTPYSVILHSSDGRRAVGELPLDVCLGDATDEELLGIAQALT